MNISDRIIERRVTDKNLNSGNLTLEPQHMVAYYQGMLTKIIVTKEDGTWLEQYYGYGLQKLIESARRYKDEDWLLAVRHLKYNPW